MCRRLLDGQLGRWVGLQSFVRYQISATYRTAVGPGRYALDGAVESRKPFTQPCRNRVIDALRAERLRRITRVAGLVSSGTVLAACGAQVDEQPLHVDALSG